ncbi:hypothetical protein Glove_535g22 [Diversispora epigaea]|uniref:Uncharacterized protein n=1 Tax=Diversispora epigaea TaxID=1348612 RepID=A0A397GIY6_9GLOM|nr:hypothetical protein Glove_535g22 [Diversispora epigaea]
MSWTNIRNPNSDEEILRVAEMYKEDFWLESDSFFGHCCKLYYGNSPLETSGVKYIKQNISEKFLKIEPKNTQGRRATGVVRKKLKDYNNNKKITTESKNKKVENSMKMN